jgi:hypothetical protein
MIEKMDAILLLFLNKKYHPLTFDFYTRILEKHRYKLPRRGVLGLLKCVYGAKLPEAHGLYNRKSYVLDHFGSEINV